MMTLTSAAASKLLKQYKLEFDTQATLERKSESFLASTEEDPDELRPDYDYDATQEILDNLNLKIRKLRHAVNVFNTTTVIPEFGITVDEMLVLIPQLTAKKTKLQRMSERLPKERDGTYSSINIEYRYVNYDVSRVSEELYRVNSELSKAQMSLDRINHAVTFDVEIDE